MFLSNILKGHRLHISNTPTIIRRMICSLDFLQEEATVYAECKGIIPHLGQEKYKGQAGRVGVIGGSLDYTGAPYFAAISAMKVGCDLAHVFCAREAAPVIKSYSPELIVHPVLDSSNALELIKPWLPRLHSLVIGPGLGRDPQILETVAKIIEYCRNEADDKKPLVIDADGLFLITEKPDVIKNYPYGAILTPNAMEFSRLGNAVLHKKWIPHHDINPEDVQDLARALGENIVIVHKGMHDVIASGEENWNPVLCTKGGSGRRCGGQGDLLSGSLGTFYYWAVMKAHDSQHIPSGVLAAYAGCLLTRLCNQKAVEKTGRSTLTTDMLKEIHPVFTELFCG